MTDKEMKRCKDCRFWKRDSPLVGFGACSCSKFVETPDGKLPENPSDNALFYWGYGEDWEGRGDFYVGENFGCIYFEGKRKN